MAAQNIPFSGFMNGDDPNENIPIGTHSYANNLIFRGNKGDMRPEKLPGTRNVAFSLPSGTNVTIGAHYDAVNNQIIFFNYNSNGTHGIYIFSVATETYQTLIQTGTNTTGDPLAFDPTVPISSIDIYYGDSITGNILFYVDSLLRPTKINIQRYLAGTYNPILRSYIDVAKSPPQMPIKAVYENDTTVNVNNLRNQLFQFIYRYKYDDNEYSVWSSTSIVPLPFQPYGTLTQNDYTLNSRISLFLSTGTADVRKIEVAFRYVNAGIVSGYYLIDSFDKTLLSLSDNDIYWYKFYNDNSYNLVDATEQVLLYSKVPQKAVAQSLLNGNVLLYSNITENYDNISAIMTASLANNTYYFDNNGLLFFATISSIDSGSVGTVMNIYLYGTGTNTAGVVTTLNNGLANNYVIHVVNGSGTDVGINITPASNVVATILGAVSTALVANGFTQISLSGNKLSVSYPTAVTILSSGVLGTTTANLATTSFGYQYQSAQSFGIMYFDSKGRTNGAVFTQASKLNTSTSYGNLSNIQLQISHRPPTWAVYYQFIRTENLTYGKLLNWVTNGAYSDPAANTLGLKYAYLEIDNIFDYNQYIEATQGVVTYSFAPGDRVRIIGRFDATGAAAAINSTYDYEVLGVVNSFVLNGITKVGTFIQIYYPTADINSNFKFDGTSNYLAYQVVIYNYTQHASSTTSNIYYEFSKCYGIGNPGLGTAFHIGDLQTQSTNLVTPAIISSTNGDLFSRQRVVPIGQSYTFTSVFIGNGFKYVSLGLTIGTSTFTNSLYTIQTSNQQQSNSLSPGDYTSANAFFLNLTSLPLTVRIRTTIPVSLDSGGQTATSVLFQAVNSDGTYQLVTAVAPISMVSGTSYNVVVDAKITVQGNAHLHIIVSNSAQFVNQNIQPFNIVVDIINNVTIPIVESSFSDVYNLPISSNGRPSVYNPNSKQATNNVLLRYSEPYQSGTNINGMNIFYDLNYDEVSKDFGGIQRTIVHARRFLIFQYRKTGVKGIYNKFIKNNDGQVQLIVSDQIITQNNINYYTDDFGVGNQQLGIAKNGNDFYFADPIKGYLIRLAEDGDIAISELYKQQIWAGANLPNYLANNAYAYGGYAKILGCFNFKKDKQGEYICVLQTGSGVTGSTIAFDEQNNAFTSFYDIQPDFIICAENKLITFRAGALYVHDNTSAYNTFYGTLYSSSIQMVFNKSGAAKKDWTYLGFVSPPTSVWTAPNIGDVTTSLGQQSNLVTIDFENREGVWHAAFPRDNNSPGGMINGDFLKGEWISIKLSNSDNLFSFLYALYIGLLNSPKNY